MLHAPTPETKRQNDASRMQATSRPERLPHPWASAYGELDPALSPASRVPVRGTNGHHRLTILQRTLGNQAVLRRLNPSAQANGSARPGSSGGVVLQRKCACGGTCAKCSGKEGAALQGTSAQAGPVRSVAPVI